VTIDTASLIAIETPRTQIFKHTGTSQGLFLISTTTVSEPSRFLPRYEQYRASINPGPSPSPPPRLLPFSSGSILTSPHARTLHSNPLHTTAPHTTAALSIFAVRLSATFLHDQPGLRSAAVTAKSQRIASTRSPITRPGRARRPLTSQPPTKSQYSKTLLKSCPSIPRQAASSAIHPHHA
jgi:hypothetical protein